AAAQPLAAAGLNVGERILRAVAATREKVGCNTNLGIVLLCAPLTHAAQSASAGLQLRRRVEKTLQDLTQHDTALVYEAIRLAAPGGLGESARHDVNQPPRVSLLEAMREAAGRDMIARQYANGFAEVFEFGVPRVREVLARGLGAEHAMLAVYLGWLAHFPDSHIARKWGDVIAREVSARAARFDARLQHGASAENLKPELSEFDAELKRDGINPGTSADLSVACVFALELENLLRQGFSGGKTVARRGKTTSQRIDAEEGGRRAGFGMGFHPKIFNQPN
ncbi:MAG: triphosphoribosyl-dephospho-CoA synthase, partial [Burkholderiales bacterium]